jgi:hypothetical protein
MPIVARTGKEFAGVSHVMETWDVVTSYEEFEAAEAEGSGGFFLSPG